MLELNIPLQQSARRAQERAAVAGEQAAEARVAAAEARQLGRLGEAWAGFESSREKAGLLRDTLLPQADATLESARTGYETGRVNFNTVIEAQRQILRTRLALLDAEADTALRLAELELLAGGSL
jgi:cobalt-zinc-cadmium efflux system outer membrane protein